MRARSSSTEYAAMKPATLRILHIEDDPEDAQRVEQELARTGTSCVIERVETSEEFVRALERFAPDVVLCDHALERFNARSALQHIRAARPVIPLIIVTGALTEELVVDYIRAGVADYVSKTNLGRLRPAIEAALVARRRLEQLSPRQVEVLRLLVEGQSTSEIARRLELSVKTVETHRMAVMDRLGLHDLPALVRFAIHVGLVPPGP